MPEICRNKTLKKTEGGWGYVIMLAVATAHLTSIVPYSVFGIIFGDFMTSLGNETSGTTLSMSVALSSCCLTGLLSSYLLEKYTFRLVGFIGAIIQFISYILTLFANKLWVFVLCYSILGGIGGGFLIPAAFSSLNEYFDKKLNLITGISQIIITVFSMIYPLCAAYSMVNFGFLNTKLILTGISLLSFFAAWSLKPVKNIQETKGPEFLENGKPLLILKEEEKRIDTKELAIQNDTHSKTKIFALIKSPKFINIVLGTALCFSCDNLFVGVIRLTLNNLKFSDYEIARMSMVHFGCDLIARIIYAIASGYCSIKNRYVFYVGTLITVIFRIAFALRDDYMWRVMTLSILGFARCCIQTPFSLVIAEEYRNDYPTAISLFFVFSGVVSLLLGQITNFVKSATNSDAMLLQVFTAAMSITVITWGVEFVYSMIKKR